MFLPVTLSLPLVEIMSLAGILCRSPVTHMQSSSPGEETEGWLRAQQGQLQSVPTRTASHVVCPADPEQDAHILQYGSL